MLRGSGLLKTCSGINNLYITSKKQTMSEAEKRRQLEEELNRLSEQLLQQQQTINRLKQELRLLSSAGKEAPAPVPSMPAAPRFSLPPSASLENLIGLRLIHLIGIVVLVIGLSLGVKYAIDADLISERMRIFLAYGAGGLLLLFAIRLKKNFAGFSAILFSGAMASVYFTTYAAFVYYGMFSFSLTFILMVLFTIYTAFEALRYNRQEIALLGMIGAYGIPFLISPNRGNPQSLFLYITIINAGIVVLSIKKLWILMGRLAQVITWIIFIGWLFLQEKIAITGMATLYAGLFFFLFFLNALSPKIVRREMLTRTHTYQLLTNNVALSLSVFLLFGQSFVNSTISTIAVYLSLFAAVQALLFQLWKEEYSRTILAWYALSLFMLFIGFQWSGIMVTLLWLLTAVVLFIFGVRRKSNPLRMTAITLMGVTLLKLVVLDSLMFSTIQKVIAYLVLGVLLLLVSFFYQKYRQQLFEE